MSTVINKALEPYQVNTLEEAVSWIKNSYNKSEFTCRDLLELGVKGKLNVCAAVGNGKLKLFNSDGEEITMMTDGLIPLARIQCHLLAINKSISLNSFEMKSGLTGRVEKFHFESPVPHINQSDLRVRGIDLLNFMKSPNQSNERETIESKSNNRTGVVKGVYEADEEIASLFDPVSPQQLDSMFMQVDKWVVYAKRAKENGLIEARRGRGKFNPYLAVLWWLERKKPVGWDLARCTRILANNIPKNNSDKKYLLTGELD